MEITFICKKYATSIISHIAIAVYMPYELGYGTTDYGVIPAYSTLVFDMALTAFYRVGTTVPQWSSNEGFFWEENY